MTVGVADVKIALAPRCVCGPGLWFVSSYQYALVHFIDVVDPEDHPAPDGLSRFPAGGELKVHEAGSGLETRELRLDTSIQHLESEISVEGNALAHVGGQQSHRADASDRMRSLLHIDSVAGNIVDRGQGLDNSTVAGARLAPILEEQALP